MPQAETSLYFFLLSFDKKNILYQFTTIYNTTNTGYLVFSILLNVKIGGE